MSDRSSDEGTIPDEGGSQMTFPKETLEGDGASGAVLAYPDAREAKCGDDQSGEADYCEAKQDQVKSDDKSAATASVESTDSVEATTPAPRRSRKLAGEFIRFGIVGGSGVLINTLVMVLMHKLHGGPEFADEQLINLPGTDFWVRYRNIVFITSFVVANIWNYQWNRRFTFDKTGRTWRRDFFPFLITGALGAILGLAVQIALTHPALPTYLPEPLFTATGTWRSRELWAQLIGVAISTPVTFGLSRVWAFRSGKPVENRAA